MRVSTKSVHFTADFKLLEFIEKKLRKLNQFADNILDVNVTLKLENAGQVRDKIAEVRLSIPGNTIVVKETNKTFEAAIDKVTDVMKRQLKRYKEKVKSKRA